MAYKILTTSSSFGKVDSRPLEILEEAGFSVTVNPYGKTLTEEQSKELLPSYDGLIAGTEKLNEDVLSSGNQLKYICRLGAGTDNVDFSAAEKLNIKVESTPSAHVDGVAELTLGGILGALRSTPTAHADLIAGVWKKPMGRLLKNKKIGIIGLGQVGKQLVRLMQPFNVQVLAFDPNPDSVFSEEFKVSYTDLDVLASESDIITIHIPFSPKVKNIIDESFLNKVKSNALIVNTSRGGLIDEDALLDFLIKNEKASAYIDTFASEPYNGPLKEVRSCSLTPHIGSYAREVRIDMEMEAANNVIKFFKQ